MISIITVCHKSSNLLPGYIGSFLEHNVGAAGSGQIEFVFVENSGDPETQTIAACLQEHGFSVQTKMVENRGFGAGCNAGAQLARGRLLVFANPDITFQTDITSIDEFFQGTRWGTVRQKRDAKVVYSFDLLPEYRSLTTELLRPYRYMHKLPFLHGLCYPIGSFMVVPRDAFLKVGGFDERFFLYYEEAELSRRLQAWLGRPSYLDAVSILHEGFGTQSSSDFTMREEAKGIITYSLVTGQPLLVQRRARMLSKLAAISRMSAQRLGFLNEAIREAAEASTSS